RGDRGGRGRLLHLVVEDAVDAIDRQGEPAAVREGQLGAIVGHLVGTDLEGIAVGQDHQLGARVAGRGCSHGERGEGGGNRAAGRHGALLYGDPGRFAYPSWERSSAARRVPRRAGARPGARLDGKASLGLLLATPPAIMHRGSHRTSRPRAAVVTVPAARPVRTRGPSL